MKKQRVLALALSATMAASMFGGMSASAAADKTDGYQSYSVTKVTDWDTIDLDQIYTGSYEDAMVDGFDKNTVYLFDYAENTTTNVGDGKLTLSGVVDAIEKAQYEDDTTSTGAGADYTAAVNALNKFYGETPEYDASVNILQMSETRTAVVDLFDDAVAAINGLDSDYYDEYDWDYYGVDAMQTAAKSTKANAKTPNSELLNVVAESERIIPLLGVTTTYEDAYYELYDFVSSLPSSDYTTTNYRTITRLLEDAEDIASAGTEAKYKEAIEKLEGWTSVQTIAPDWSDLKAAVEGMFSSGSPTPTYDGGANCYYKVKDYGKNSEAWIMLVGGTLDGEKVTGAYTTAYDIYQKCRYASTRKYVGQSVVDDALAQLDEALLNLEPNFSSENWVIVMLEDALDSTSDIVESDYRTNSSSWRNYTKAVEAVENLLDAAAVRESVARTAVKDLKDAIDGLSACKISVPTATRTDMRATIKEAKELLEDKSNKTASQILTLQAAYDAAVEINTKVTSTTISAYEAALADLETAITGYSQVQGWYQQNGTWYYGQGDTTAKGWLNLNGTWYYLDPTTGAMATGWLQLGSTWYYLKDWGGMATGWQQVNGSWYYFQSWGGMVSNGWYWIGGSCYYFYNWGGMAANTTIDGYTVNASGAWVR